MAANIRFATEADIPVILEFIHALAAYENMEDQVIVTPELLKEWVFQKKKAEVFLVSEDEKPVGFALFFHNFSTWLGRAGIYLEDLFVLPEYRGKGYAMNAKVGKEGIELAFEEYLHGTNSVENTIWRLRRKLEPDPRNPIYIKTVIGAGYKIEIPNNSDRQRR